MKFQLIQVSTLLEMILKNSTVKKLMRKQNTEIVSELSGTENTHLSSDESIDNELQNPPRYPERESSSTRKTCM